MPSLQPLINLHRRQAEHVNTKSVPGNSQTQVLTTCNHPEAIPASACSNHRASCPTFQRNTDFHKRAEVTRRIRPYREAVVECAPNVSRARTVFHIFGTRSIDRASATFVGECGAGPVLSALRPIRLRRPYNAAPAAEASVRAIHVSVAQEPSTMGRPRRKE